MLRKLFKYDFLDSCRWLWMVYAGLVLTAALSGFTARLDLSDVQNHGAGVLLVGVSSVLLFLMVGAIFIVTFIQIVVRFYRNLLKGEGYLMHTLPVHTWQLLTSKLLCAVVLILFAFLTCAIAAGVWVLCSGTAEELSNMGTSLAGIYNFYFSGINGAGVIIRSLLSGFLGTLTLVLTCYAALALGQLAHNHRILLAFACFIGIRLVMSILRNVVTIVQSTWHQNSSMIVTMMTSSGSIARMLVQGIICVGCFILTEQLLRRHLNLE